MKLFLKLENPIWFSFLLIIITLLTIATFSPKFRVLSLSPKHISDDKFKIAFDGAKTDQTFHADIEIDSGWQGTSQLMLGPDDCLLNIRLEGVDIYSFKEFCSWPNGQIINLPRVIYGKQILEVDFKNRGGQAGLALTLSSTDRFWPLLYAVIIASSLTALFFLKKQKTFIYLIILTIGFLFRVFYLSVTTFWNRQMDSRDHLKFISYIYEHLSLPSIGFAAETHQAPLYYLLSAGLLKFSSEFNGVLLNAQFNLQCLSLIFEFLALGFILSLISEISETKKSRLVPILVAIAISLFSGVILLSPRISNDALFYLFSIVSFYFLFRFHFISSDWRLWWSALVTAALAFLTKITGIIIILVVLFVLILSYKKGEKSIFLKRVVLSLAFISLSTGWFVNYRFFGSPRAQIGGFFRLSTGLNVPNTISEYTTFRPLKVIDRAYFRPWGENDQRKNFWEALITSAFFGEYKFGEYTRFASRSLLICALILVPLISICLFIDGGVVCSVAVALFLAALLFYRWSEPYSCNQDFRFIVPVVFPFVVALINSRWSLLVSAVLICFCVCLSWFWLSLLQSAEYIITH